MLTEKDKREIAETMNHDAEEQRNERDYPSHATDAAKMYATTEKYFPGFGDRAKNEAVKSFKREAWQLCGELLNELAVYDARFFERHGGPAARAFLKPNDENQTL